MAIPDFQTGMLPVLEAFADGTPRRVQDLVGPLAERFALTDAERREPLPSGKQRRFDNRVHWAASYLSQARLLEARPGHFKMITARGQTLLSQKPEQLSTKVLSRYPEFQAFKAKSKVKDALSQPVLGGAAETLEESLEASWKALRDQLAASLLESVRSSSPAFFERVVVDLLVAMGYGGSQADAARVVGRSGDEGIDGVIKEDRLGLDAVYVQAKKWEGVVGSPAVQTFAGGLDGKRASKGVMITTSSFSKDARDFVEKISKKIVLIDGEALAGYMIDFGVGVTTSRTYEIKRVDLDYFEEN